MDDGAFAHRPALLLPQIVVAKEDIEAEQQLLGCLLMNPGRAVPKIPTSFSSAHYADELHRNIHDVIIDLGDGATPITVTHTLGLDREQGSYLAKLLQCGTSWRVVDSAAHTVTEAHRRRELAQLLNDVRMGLEQGSREAPASGLIHLAMARLDAMLDNTGNFSTGGTLDDAIAEVLRLAEQAFRGESRPGWSTGMPSVDKALGGLENGTFNVLGGRPSQGKTALAVQWAVSVAQACKASGECSGVLGFSLEMSRVALARRVLSHASNISAVDIKRGQIDGRGETLVRASKGLQGLPIMIEDAGGQNLVCIRQKARAAQRRYGKLALIWVDHINIVKPDDVDRRNGNTQAVGRISNQLRDLSKEFNCPVLCLAQLNRGLLEREDKRPNLGDLRQSGDIEQDADVVMFIHREEVYIPKSPPARGATETQESHSKKVSQWEDARARSSGKAELLLEKVRDGAPSSVSLEFHHETISFADPGS